MASSTDTEPLLRKIESLARFTLSTAERSALADIPMRVQALRADQDIVRLGDRPSRCCVLLEGFACVYKMTADGKRQITAFHIPGDIPDLQSLHLRTLDNSVGTLTACRVGFVDHEVLQVLCHTHPRIAGVLWRETLIDASIFREWMLNIGRRGAYSRLAHVLCELVTRLDAVGLVDDQTCELPMTQIELGDATGLTPVHVNRMLQEMRGAGLITLKNGSLTVHDSAGLKQIGEFDPIYLHLERPA
ncbi:Crp/Fnr family transcriptional regulator [Salinarimonas soli]|uniref:Crp/Fnr family transcriptional regulator n=1 Tax=Salinarimonas soli TaxID=1638099 RepID=A0A5B2VA20_9HYPH|nr:Crp/Fnr family transcriptional regulator [Salinarimonas soli]KAA2235189.1 Crp/Fnr family transcriptional regulator [Salinarimonas soli]